MWVLVFCGLVSIVDAFVDGAFFFEGIFSAFSFVPVSFDKRAFLGVLRTLAGLPAAAPDFGFFVPSFAIVAIISLCLWSILHRERCFSIYRCFVLFEREPVIVRLNLRNYLYRRAVRIVDH